MIIVLGVLIAFVPFTGFPDSFKTTLAIVFGLAIAALGFLVRQERLWLLRSLRGEHATDGYAENNPRRSALID